jgi:hypothetical protein
MLPPTGPRYNNIPTPTNKMSTSNTVKAGFFAYIVMPFVVFVLPIALLLGFLYLIGWGHK